MKKLLISTALLAVISTTSAQALSISSNLDAMDLANTLFLNSPGTTIQSAVLLQNGTQAGVFGNELGTYGLPQTGIVLSSGNVEDYGDGQSSDSNTSTSYDVAATSEQNALLVPVTSQSQHYDVVQLTIDFIPTVASMSFFSTFGSEEWPEFVGSGFIDGFGLYVNGVNVAGAVPTGGGTPQAININHPDMIEFSGTELDGVLAPDGNPVMQFDVPVTIGEVNTFDIILADAGDSSLDTTIFLSSFVPTSGGGGIVYDGSSEFAALLPDNPPDPETGAFIITLPEPPIQDVVVWIDPPVAVGYTYAVEDAFFASITAPSLATVPDVDGYIVTVNGIDYALGAAQTLDFATLGLSQVSEFLLSGIAPALLLDPENPLAFPIGASFTDIGTNVAITITPTVEDYDPVVSPVPLPAGAPLLLTGMFGVGLLRRRRRSA